MNNDEAKYISNKILISFLQKNPGGMIAVHASVKKSETVRAHKSGLLKLVSVFVLMLVKSALELNFSITIFANVYVQPMIHVLASKSTMKLPANVNVQQHLHQVDVRQLMFGIFFHAPVFVEINSHLMDVQHRKSGLMAFVNVFVLMLVKSVQHLNFSISTLVNAYVPLMIHALVLKFTILTNANVNVL